MTTRLVSFLGLGIANVPTRYTPSVYEMAGVRSSRTHLIERALVKMRLSLESLDGLGTLDELRGMGKLSAEQRAAHETRVKLCNVFDATLGEEDHGLRKDQFEAGLLAARLERVKAQYEIAEELKTLSKLFSDDALGLGSQVAGPGLLGVNLAKSLASGSAAFRSLLAPLLDALREMTRAARDAEPEPTPGEKPPK